MFACVDIGNHKPLELQVMCKQTNIHTFSISSFNSEGQPGGYKMLQAIHSVATGKLIQRKQRNQNYIKMYHLFRSV